MGAHFGPAGNSLSFFEKGFKHSYEAPAYVKSMGLDAYEYSAGNGVTGGAVFHFSFGNRPGKAIKEPFLHRKKSVGI